MRLRPINKRGNSATDLIVYMVSGLVMAIVLILIFYYGSVTAEWFTTHAESFSSNGVNGTEIIANTFGKLPTAYENLKWISVGVMIAMAIAILLGNALVRVHGWYIVPYFIFCAIAVIFSVFISEAYEGIYNTPALNSYFAQFSGLSWIFLNLQIWITVVGLFGAIPMFSHLIKEKISGGNAW